MFVIANSHRCYAEAAMALANLFSGTLNEAILGNGPNLVYPSPRVSTHPFMTLRSTDYGEFVGESSLCKDYGPTSLCCLLVKCFVK